MWAETNEPEGWAESAAGYLDLGCLTAEGRDV